MTLVLCGSARADPILSEARALIEAGRPAEAMAILAPHENVRAGDLDFDYLLGLAALDSGDPQRAIFAFERILAQQPNNVAAQGELARALAASGDVAAARAETERLLQQDLPPEVRDDANRYLSTLGRSASGGSSAVVKLRVGLGHDSNASSASSDTSVTLVNLGNLTFEQPLVGKRDSGIFDLALSFDGNHDINEHWVFYGGGSIEETTAWREPDFSTRIVNGYLGTQRNLGRHALRLSGNLQRYFLGGDPLRDFGAVSGEWQYRWRDATQLTLFAQAAAQRFPDIETRDINSASLGLGATQVLDMAWSPILFASAFYGEDHARDSARDDVGRDFLGTRIGSQLQPHPRASVYLSLTYIDSKFGGVDPIAGVSRDDDLIVLVAGASWRLTALWEIVPEFTYTQNDSTAGLNEFKRSAFLLNSVFRF